MRIVVAATVVAGVLLVPQPASAAPGWKDAGSKAFKSAGALLQVAAVNKRTIFAINENGKPFHWNGRKWTAKKAPFRFRPTGIAASSARSAWAVGYTGVTPVAAHWNGRKWKKVGYQGAKFGPLDLPLIPLSLSAGKDGAVWSVAGLNSKNDGASAVRRWNGRAFVNVNVPGAAGASLTAVSVRGKDDVWLGGTTTANGTQVVATVLRLSGGKWKQLAAPGGSWGVVGQPHNIIQEIAAAGPGKVWAIRAQNGGGLLRWNGSKWSEAASPLISHYALAPDGGSGAWTIPSPGTGKTRSQYLHWAGKWRTLRGPDRKKNTYIHDIAQIPGTRQIVAVGSVEKNKKQLPIVEFYR
ncbi:hypothetical protein [Actinocorallia populi]|uniref:hypothetical protein n=1 Tax=Actinocorallia populi TaxID=2079200 RepID=UPI000D08F998|nr:hypothetical protein [Actinocorallia populi]